MVMLNKQEKMFSSDMMGFLCFKNTFVSLRRLQSGSNETGCPRAGYLSSRARAKLMRLKLQGKSLGRFMYLKPRKILDPTCSFGPG